MTIVLFISLVPMFVLAATMILAPDAVHGLMRWWYGVTGHHYDVLIKSRTRLLRTIRIAGVAVLLAALVMSYAAIGVLSL